MRNRTLVDNRIDSLLEARFGRRQFFQSSVAVLLLGALSGASQASKMDFTSLPSDQIQVASGYRSRVLLRWGDPILPGAPDFDATRQSAAAQARQFGFNCDYVGFLPLSGPSHGLLVVNHEYTSAGMMFPNYEGKLTRALAEVEWAAHGLSVVEVRRQEQGWKPVLGSKNRRITALTPMLISGPAAGHEWMKTSQDSSGTRVLGTLGNCSGGKTPWNTVLTAEENFHNYFGPAEAIGSDHPQAANFAQFGFGKKRSQYGWEAFDARFDLGKDPNEANRFGWVVEVDPFSPNSTPIKRTALGRFAHEAATTTVAPDGRLVVYMGDDQKFERVYKFVSAGPELGARALDEGTLYTARFEADGSGRWLPLVYSQGPLTEENGFASQAEVLIQTRRAAQLMGATAMDRPEDIEVVPDQGRVYIVLTKNDQRGDGKPGHEVNPANPRAENRDGHILELLEDGQDPTAESFRWEPFLVCGHPSDPSTYFGGFPREQVAPISCPDNLVLDPSGNLWIATDGMPKSLGSPDGFFVVPLEGEERGKVRQFMRSVPGSEVCGPEFTPDGKTLFLAIQHPGEGGTHDRPLSRFPDGTIPARPSVVVIEGLQGQTIGT